MMTTSRVRLVVLAVTAAAAFASVPSAGAATHHAARSACARLQGYDLAPDASVRLMWQRYDDGRDRGSTLVGCVLPAGKVRTIAYTSDVADDIDVDITQLDKVAGTQVLTSHYTADQYVVATGYAVYDLRTGRSHDVASKCSGQECYSWHHNGELRSTPLDDVPTAHAAAPAVRPSTCAHLQGRDLAADHAVRLIWQRADSAHFLGSKLVACILPAGKVRTLVTVPDLETTTPPAPSPHADVSQSAGRKVLLHKVGSGPDGIVDTWSVYDIATGGRRTIISRCSGGGCSSGGGFDVFSSLLNRRGEVVAILRPNSFDATTMTVAKFDADGTRHVLETGPSPEYGDDITRTSPTTVSWLLRSGQRHSTRLVR
jgi:hypothetical protein